jgi:hypothetical protein
MVFEEDSLDIFSQFGKWTLRPQKWKSLKHKDSIIYYTIDNTVFIGEVLAIYKVRSTATYVISVGRIPPPYNYWSFYTLVQPQKEYLIKDFVEISSIRTKGYLVEFPFTWYICDTHMDPSILL